MIRIALLFALVFFVGCSTPQLRPVSLPKVNVLPLALNDAFEFRKTLLYLNGENKLRTNNEMLIARQRRANFGAVDNTDIISRRGNYFTFYWRAHRDADLTVRLEYRTEKLGNYVQAREITYLSAKGSHRTDFEIIGDNYADDGRITAWRAVLIENAHIVALNQSFLWN